MNDLLVEMIEKRTGVAITEESYVPVTPLDVIRAVERLNEEARIDKNLGDKETEGSEEQGTMELALRLK